MPRIKKIQVTVDDRTEQRRLPGSKIRELKARKAQGKGTLELTLWSGRHNGDDLQKKLSPSSRKIPPSFAPCHLR